MDYLLLCKRNVRNDKFTGGLFDAVAGEVEALAVFLDVELVILYAEARGCIFESARGK